jgi:hypothetical protein
MPAPLLTASAMIMCIHGGQVTVIPGQSQVTAGGSAVLSGMDLLTCPIIGCPQAGPGIVPCTMILLAEPVAMPSPIVMIGGMPALTVAAVGQPGGLTNGNPPGMIIINSPGQMTVMG